jgi:integrase
MNEGKGQLVTVVGVKRPKVESYEGKTPALGDGQARALLDAPGSETLKGRRDRAILSVLLYHGLRREELCTLKVRDIHPRRGVLHLRVHVEVWRALAAGQGRHQCARPRGRYRQGAGVARPRQHRHHPAWVTLLTLRYVPAMLGSSGSCLS